MDYFDFSEINLAERKQRDYLEKEVRNIFENSGKILHKVGEPKAQFGPALKHYLKVGGEAFATGAFVGAFGQDSKLIDPSQFNESRIDENGREIAYSLPVTDESKERATYYFNLGRDIINYAKENRKLEDRDFLRILGSFNEVLKGTNRSEYMTVLNLSYSLGLIDQKRYDRYLTIPPHLEAINLEIGDNMKKVYSTYMRKFLKNNQKGMI